MRKYLTIFFILALTLISLKPGLASIDLIIPLTLSSNDIRVGDSLNVHANWNETVNSSLIEFNSTSVDLMNYTLDVNSTWTNYTINTNSSWLLGPHAVRIYVLSTVEEGNVKASTNQSFFKLWGYSKSLIQLSSDNISIGSSVKITCRVIDENTSNPITDYYVEARSSLEGDIQSVAGLTNSSGYREDVFTPTKNGTHVITCIIFDSPLKFYTAIANSSSNLKVIQPEVPSFVGRGILNVEKALMKSGLIEMPSGLNATLKNYTILINNLENSTMNFSLFIGNQLVIESSIPAGGSYTINYSTIMGWKETYHLVNLHKVRIKVEGVHDFKSLITQDYVDVYVDIVVSKKAPKSYEINVSSTENVSNILVEGNIPLDIDIDKVKLYRWNVSKKDYEDVTSIAEYNVSIDKTNRKISFTIPHLSTQSFILMEGEMVTTTTTTATTVLTTTVPKTTTTVRITTTKPVTTTIPVCPTCPSPSEWSECVNRKKSRTVYKCDSTTNYKCQPFVETVSCLIRKDYTFVAILIILLVIIVLYFIWKFKIHEKLPKRKFEYHYKT
ncbi:MAG: hypothetical protein QMD36_03630 [Candidatus Aenigmarchaeota archaeon]|nr:hypothetical protein [Candidatus Aenigmarchaeota archaeon]